MSHHGINPRILFCAVHLEVEFEDVDTEETVKTTSGSGFFYYTGKNICLVTNRHMVDADFRSEKNFKRTKIKKLLIGQVGWDSTNSAPTEYKRTEVKLIDIVHHENSSIDIAALVNPGLHYGEFHETIPTYLDYNHLPTPKEWAKLTICDKVFFPSYNKFYDQLNHYPIIRSGRISSFPGKGYSGFSGMNFGPVIALEAFSHGGSSGAPVFAGSKYLQNAKDNRRAILAGIIAGHLSEKGYNRESSKIEEIHSGISYMYPASEIKLLLDQIDQNYVHPQIEEIKSNYITK